MTRENHNDLWRDFPKTATEFEARFATEDDCRAYWIQARWGASCVRAVHLGARVDDPRGHHVRVCGLRTPDEPYLGHGAGKTRKPFKMWFRAVFEISTRRTGISAKDLQRIMGFGSHETAWT